MCGTGSRPRVRGRVRGAARARGRCPGDRAGRLRHRGGWIVLVFPDVRARRAQATRVRGVRARIVDRTESEQGPLAFEALRALSHQRRLASSSKTSRAQSVTVIVRNVTFSMMPPGVGALKNRNTGVPAETV